jgi:hypothetical protein
MTSPERKTLIEAYCEGPSALAEALRRYPRKMWQFREKPGCWTIHEIVVHTADSEVNGYVRLRALLAEPGKTLMAFDQNLWANRLDYHGQSPDDAMELLVVLRRLNCHLLEAATEAAWKNTVEHPETGTMNLEDWLAGYARHIPRHINQMQRVFEAWQAHEQER